MLTITFVHHGKSITAMIPTCQAPALRSAIQEIRDELGGRASGAHKYHKEDALTRAVDAIGKLSAAINYVIPEEDPDYA